MTAAALWLAVEAARDREALAALACSLAAFEDRAAWWAAAGAHAEALADLRRVEAAYWADPGAGARAVAMLAA